MSTNSTTPARPLSVAEFDYALPAELIAQAPLPGRADSRLLVLEGAKAHHRAVRDLPDLLAPGDRLVFNDTRVIPARLFGRKASGGQVELMLERLLDDTRALVRLRASKTPRPGGELTFRPRDGGAELRVRVAGRDGELFIIESDAPLGAFLEAHGEVPLPPYIERDADAEDRKRYQTLWARESGAVAAPTAGLHFDRALLDALAARGVDSSRITLHVGAGTFQPIRVDDPAEHVMHAERIEVAQSTVDEIAATRAAGGRIVAVGTTVVRALEGAAAENGGELAAFTGETRLFLTPGARFRVVERLLTNFHLPKSTLLMLVSAFAGTDAVLGAYREAVEQRYRFFSYGDAMLLDCAGAPGA